MAVYKDNEKCTWYCKFRYKDWQEKTRETTKRGFRTKKEAKQYESDILASAQVAPTFTFAKLAEMYLNDLKSRTTPNTVKTASSALNNHVIPYLKDVGIDKITPNTIRKWQIEIGKKQLADSTVLIIDTYFSACMEFAVNFYNLPSNPFEKVGKQGKLSRRQSFLEPQELDELIKAESNPYYRMIWLVLAYSGMRVGELMALSAKDINVPSSTISITKSYNHDTKIVSKPKHGSSRVIALPSFVMELIDNYLSRHYEIPDMPFAIKSDRAMRDAIKKTCKAAGIEKNITVHDLRHTHASMLIHRGIPITDISRRLGHANPAITLKTYSHFYNDSDKAIADNLEECGQNVVRVY